jgi:spore coat polysaccharide biosynthesis protein SpsF (cytidylyltransferase family)
MKTPRICAFIAVRMKSKRLPKKALANIEGYTALERVINNIKPSKFVDEIIIATSTNKQDDVIVKLAKDKGIPYFRGDKDNVIKRYFDASEKFKTDIIVRVTGDCPLMSFEIIDYLIKEHLKQNADFTSLDNNRIPIGTFPEIINSLALKKLMSLDIDLSYSEYMTFYFINNPELFSINIVPCNQKKFIRPNYRMTLDYPEDLEFFRVLFQELGSQDKAIPLRESIEFLDNNPEIAHINKDQPLKWKEDADLIKKLNNITKYNQ